MFRRREQEPATPEPQKISIPRWVFIGLAFTCGIVGPWVTFVTSQLLTQEASNVERMRFLEFRIQRIEHIQDNLTFQTSSGEAYADRNSSTGNHSEPCVGAGQLSGHNLRDSLRPDAGRTEAATPRRRLAHSRSDSVFGRHPRLGDF